MSVLVAVLALSFADAVDGGDVQVPDRGGAVDNTVVPHLNGIFLGCCLHIVVGAAAGTVM